MAWKKGDRIFCVKRYTYWEDGAQKRFQSFLWATAVKVGTKYAYIKTDEQYAREMRVSKTATLIQLPARDGTYSLYRNTEEAATAMHNALVREMAATAIRRNSLNPLERLSKKTMLSILNDHGFESPPRADLSGYQDKPRKVLDPEPLKGGD